MRGPLPNSDSFHIGDWNYPPNPITTIVAVTLSRLGILIGRVENISASQSLVFAAYQSPDNGFATPYSPISLLVDNNTAHSSACLPPSWPLASQGSGSGSSPFYGSGSGVGAVVVASGTGSTEVPGLLVQPKGYVDFTIDTITQPFVLFEASPQPGAVGVLYLVSPKALHLTPIAQIGVQSGYGLNAVL